MFTFPESKQSLVKIWLLAFFLCARTFSKVWYFVIIMLLPAALHLIFFTPKSLEVEALHAQSTVGGSIMSIIALLVFLLCFTLMLYRIYFHTDATKSSIKVALKFVGSKSASVLAAFLIVYLLTALFAMLAVALISAFAGKVVGIIAGIIVALFLFLLFGFIIPLILFTDAAIFAAIKQSAKLVWGNWWRTFIIICVPFMVVFLATGIFSAGIGMLFHMADNWINNTIFGVIFVLFMPYMTSLMLLQFNDLQLRKKLVK